MRAILAFRPVAFGPVAFGLAIALAQSAQAGDWRYCLAPSHAEHKIYMSPPFPATVSMDEAEAQFGTLLSRGGRHFDDVQCPRSDGKAGIITMQRHAIAVNREFGNKIVNIRWKPGG
jgi:hypothetical protein